MDELHWSHQFVARGGSFWFKFMLTKTCQHSWCAAITDLTNLSLKFASPAGVNKVEREFASKSLVNSYGVPERFVKILFIASSSIT